MANPVVNLFCGIWSCLKGSLRIVLFFACLLLAIFSLHTVYSTISDDSPANWIRENLLQEKRSWCDYMAAFSLLAVSLLGAYGSFYNHRPSIKLFAITVALGSLFTGASLYYSLGNNEMNEVHTNLVGVMKNFAKEYDWSQKNFKDNATLTWDMLQHLKCCGLDSLADWDAYRPSYVPKNDYPRSCCKFQNVDGYCNKRDVYDSGCMSTIRAIETMVIVVTGFIIAFMFLLSVIAYVLLIPERSDSRSTGSQRSVLPQDYQRYEGSAVYVRQPPVAPQYQQMKQSAPPMYPNAHDIEKAAPPSYY